MMENGVEVTEEPLSHRINYIIAKFRAKQNDKDKMFDSPGPSTSKNGKMKANTEKRIKAKENDRKDCLIYWSVLI